MKLRKTSYASISFPLERSRDRQDPLDLYLKELGIQKPLSWPAVIRLVINLYHDYLEGKIDNRELSSAAFALITEISTSNLVRKVNEHTGLRILVSDIDNYLDIEWLAHSPGFNELKSDMANRLTAYEALHEQLTREEK